MAHKPSSSEEEYFAREDAEKKRKLALARVKELAAAERKQLRELHHMRCPKCGMELSTIAYSGVEVDKCWSCHGIWLDDGELEKIAGKDKEGYWSRMFKFFAKKDFAS
jgi:uncharacterized protein